MSTPCGIVTLTTDFGQADSYVAQLHAVLLRAYPDVRIVDVSHAIPPGDRETALFVTESAWPHFPTGAVHLVVVDPGVGTGRRLVALQTADAFLVGPDTGVLSSGLPPPMRPPTGVEAAPLAEGVAAVDIGLTAVRATEVSATFHGRDIMAPVAARLAAGASLRDLGSPIERVTAAAALAAPIRGGRSTGQIMYIDRFGNAITNFRSNEASGRLELAVAGVRIAGLATSYQEGRESGEPHAVVIGGSSGYLEIAWPNGSAADRLSLAIGDTVKLYPRDER